MTDKTANIEFTEKEIEWVYTLLGCLSEKYLKDMAKEVMPNQNYDRFIALYEKEMEYNVFLKFHEQMKKIDLEKELKHIKDAWKTAVAQGITELSFDEWKRRCQFWT